MLELPCVTRVLSSQLLESWGTTYDEYKASFGLLFLTYGPTFPPALRFPAPQTLFFFTAALLAIEDINTGTLCDRKRLQA